MLDRRDLIRLIARATGLNLLAGGFVPGRRVLAQEEQRSSGPATEDRPSTAVDLEAILEAYFPGSARERVREIGAICVEELAEEEGRLRSQLTETLPLNVSNPTREEALRALEEAVRADFEALRIRSIRGWQLAETEVRLCALVELVARGEAA